MARTGSRNTQPSVLVSRMITVIIPFPDFWFTFTKTQAFDVSYFSDNSFQWDRELKTIFDNVQQNLKQLGRIPWNEEILPLPLIYLLANVGGNLAQQQLKHAHLAGLGMQQPAISQMQKPVDFGICRRTQNLTLYLTYYSVQVHNQQIWWRKIQF